jgi:hypothetical protein
MRPLERPRRRWVDNIKMDLVEILWGSSDWISLVIMPRRPSDPDITRFAMKKFVFCDVVQRGSCCSNKSRTLSHPKDDILHNYRRANLRSHEDSLSSWSVSKVNPLDRTAHYSYDLRPSRRRIWRISSSGMWALVRTDVSEETTAIVRVEIPTS